MPRQAPSGLSVPAAGQRWQDGHAMLRPRLLVLRRPSAWGGVPPAARFRELPCARRRSRAAIPGNSGGPKTLAAPRRRAGGRRGRAVDGAARAGVAGAHGVQLRQRAMSCTSDRFPSATRFFAPSCKSNGWMT
eukprot:scaffold842_cov227-Pinguiococcus_pyrenoidosus.AAC.13